MFKYSNIDNPDVITKTFVPDTEISFDNELAKENLKRRTLQDEQNMRLVARYDLEEPEMLTRALTRMTELKKLKDFGARGMTEDMLNELNDLERRVGPIAEIDRKLNEIKTQKANKHAMALKIQEGINKEREKLADKKYGETEEGYKEGLVSAERIANIENKGKSPTIDLLKKEYEKNLDIINQSVDESGNPISNLIKSRAIKRNKAIYDEINGGTERGGISRQPEVETQKGGVTRPIESKPAQEPAQINYTPGQMSIMINRAIESGEVKPQDVPILLKQIEEKYPGIDIKAIEKAIKRRSSIKITESAKSNFTDRNIKAVMDTYNVSRADAIEILKNQPSISKNISNTLNSLEKSRRGLQRNIGLNYDAYRQ